MEKSFQKILNGYRKFREKYAHGDQHVMQQLADHGQKPDIMVLACCDSRVDPAIILQCDPGDIFTVRNIANIIPPYENDEAHHSTSAALEFGIGHLNVKHLIILAHSQCGGMQALASKTDDTDFIGKWVSLVKPDHDVNDCDQLAKASLKQSYKHALTFPWIKQRVDDNQLAIHLWFFDIKKGQISEYSPTNNQFLPINDLSTYA